jgi:hypothetical protein
MIEGILFSLPVLVIGWIVNKKLNSHWLCWVWILPFIWLLYGIWDSYSIYHSNPWYPLNKGTFGHMVWRDFFVSEGESDSPLTFVVFTFPALGAAAFSLGAWIALRAKQMVKSNITAN